MEITSPKYLYSRFDCQPEDNLNFHKKKEVDGFLHDEGKKTQIKKKKFYIQQML